MVHENVLVVFFSPNGITFHSLRPDLVIIVIFLTSSGAMGICQTLIANQELKTTQNALIDSKHLQSVAWEKSPALSDD